MYSYLTAEERVPQEHPLRAVLSSVDQILREMSREFDTPIGTIKRRLHVARNRLRGELESGAKAAANNNDMAHREEDRDAELVEA